MAKVLKVTKPDGMIHHVALSNKRMYDHLNNIYGPGHQFLLEVIDSEDVDTTKWKDHDIAGLTIEKTKDLSNQLKKSNDEKDELQKKLDELTARLAQTQAAPAVKLTAPEAIDLIGKVTSAEELAPYAEDARITVQAAYQKKLDELTAKA